MRITPTAGLFAVFVMFGAIGQKTACAASTRAPLGDYTQSDDSSRAHAFIYADHTVVELDSYSSALTIKDDSDGTIGFTRDGRYARLSGKLNHFTAFIDGHPVVFTRRGWAPPKIESIQPLPALKTVATIPPRSAPVAAASAPVALVSPALALSPHESVVVVPARPTAASAPVAASSVLASALTAPQRHTSAPAMASMAVATVTLPPAKPSAPIAPRALPLPTWTLVRGKLVGLELKRWAAIAGWNVVWQLPRDIVVPADTTFSGNFQKSAADVITTLAGNGLLIHTKFYEANRTMVVSGPGTTPQ